MKENSRLTLFSEFASRALRNGLSEFFSLQDPFRELVYESDVLASIADYELRRILEDPAFDSPFWEPDHLILGGGSSWQLRVGLYLHSSEFIYTMSQHMIIAVLGDQPLNAFHYYFPDSADIEVFIPELKLQKGIKCTHPPGSIIVIDSGSDIIDVDIYNPVLVVKLSSIINQPLQWAFRRDTRKSIQAIAANPVDSELVSMARALGGLAHPMAIPSLLDLVRHPRHFVRWAAIQALGCISSEQVLPCLRRAAAEDPHPHIRSAAERALSCNFARS